MASPSKEEQILKLILENSPLKEWHFEEIIRESKVTKAAANKWLKKYVKDGILHHVKESGKFPYFTVGKSNPFYSAKKRFYALKQLYESRLIAELLLSPKIKTAILFGSFARGDWYKNSDIDLFIVGSGFKKQQLELKLNRQIELHTFRNIGEIKQVQNSLLKNVINGYIIKGDVSEIAGLL